MSQEMRSAQALARQLIARESHPNEPPERAPIAVQAACERLYAELSRLLGVLGSYELFARALAQTRAQHQALGAIRLSDRSEPVLNGVTESIHAQGAVAVATALEALLVTVLEVLERLIGNAMTAQLVARSGPVGPRHGETPSDDSPQPGIAEHD